MSTPTTSKNRLANLDIVRGLAAIIVVLFHYTVIFPRFYPEGKVIDFAFSYGFYGVHLFFMVSGFVILMSLAKSRGDGFAKSRFIRLYPVYWVSMLLTAVAVWFAAPFAAGFSISDILVNLTMAQGFLQTPNIDGVYWSLTYELGFYIFLYAIFRLRLDHLIRFVPYYMTMAAALFPMVMAYIPHPVHLVIGFHDYGHLFACGLSLYLIRQHGWSALQSAVLVTAPLIQFQYDGWAGGLFCAAAILIMIWGTQLPHHSRLVHRPLLWLGSVSYALYLTHQMIGYILLARLQQAGLSAAASFALALALALALAHVLTMAVERPSARYLKTLKFFKNRPLGSASKAG